MADSELKIAVVCSSNQNRSMEAHNFLSKKGFNVRSFGTGSQVKLPGPAANQPNIYDFDTTYDDMYRDLIRKDSDLISIKLRDLGEMKKSVDKVQGDLLLILNKLYKQNGILHMLDRNRRIKKKPERFQACKDHFDIIVSCEERVYDQILEDLGTREQTEMAASHIINIDIQDNHEEATIGAFLIRDLVTMLSECDDIDNEIDEVIQDFEARANRTILHTAIFL